MNPEPSAAFEFRKSGKEFAMPLVERISALESHTASRMTWHRHESFELLFLLEGATAYEFQEKETVHLRGGHFLIIPPGRMHRGVENLRLPANLCGIVLHDKTPHCHRTPHFTRAELAGMIARFESRALMPHPMSSELRRTINSLCVELRTDIPWTRLQKAKFRLLVSSTLVESARALRRTNIQKTGTNIAISIAWMEKHFNETISMDELAEAAGYGRASWFALFKQATGMTPNDYLQRLRVEQARKLLADPSLTVTDIAFAVGFSSSQYFSKVFRKYTGTAPGASRRESIRHAAPKSQPPQKS